MVGVLLSAGASTRMGAPKGLVRQGGESFIAHVLEKQRPRPRDQIWMLRQSPEIRDSYVREVLLGDD